MFCSSTLKRDGHFHNQKIQYPENNIPEVHLKYRQIILSTRLQNAALQRIGGPPENLPVEISLAIPRQTPLIRQIFVLANKIVSNFANVGHDMLWQKVVGHPIHFMVSTFVGDELHKL